MIYVVQNILLVCLSIESYIKLWKLGFEISTEMHVHGSSFIKKKSCFFKCPTVCPRVLSVCQWTTLAPKPFVGYVWFLPKWTFLDRSDQNREPTIFLKKLFKFRGASLKNFRTFSRFLKYGSTVFLYNSSKNTVKYTDENGIDLFPWLSLNFRKLSKIEFFRRVPTKWKMEFSGWN